MVETVSQTPLRPIAYKVSRHLTNPDGEIQSEWISFDPLDEINCLRTRIQTLEAEVGRLHTLRPKGDYHEDMGPVLWWIWPICEPPYCGAPGDSDWPGYHTHFSPLPNCAALSTSMGE